MGDNGHNEIRVVVGTLRFLFEETNERFPGPAGSPAVPCDSGTRPPPRTLKPSSSLVSIRENPS